MGEKGGFWGAVTQSNRKSGLGDRHTDLGGRGEALRVESWPSGVEPVLLLKAPAGPIAQPRPAVPAPCTEQGARCPPGRRRSGMLPDPGAQLSRLGPAPLPALQGTVPMVWEGMRFVPPLLPYSMPGIGGSVCGGHLLPF